MTTTQQQITPLDRVTDLTDFLETERAKRLAQSPQIHKIMHIVREFIRNNDMILYGGVALNELLPQVYRFYDPEQDVPDYDAFTSQARQKAIELADALFEAGFETAQARSALHPGTYKVYADFINVADFTDMAQKQLNKIDSYVGEHGLRYIGPIWARIDLYKELALTEADISRWPKVFNRLMLIEKYAPLDTQACKILTIPSSKQQMNIKNDLYGTLLSTAIDAVQSLGLVMYGAPIWSYYLTGNNPINDMKYAPLFISVFGVPTMVVMAENGKQTAITLGKILANATRMSVRIVVYPAMRQFTDPIYSIYINDLSKTIPFITVIDTTGLCLAYQQVDNAKFATVSSLLFVYLSAYFSDTPSIPIDPNILLCMIDQLIKQIMAQEPTQILPQDGKYALFSTDCYGIQETRESILKERYETWLQRRLLQLMGQKTRKTMLNYSPQLALYERQHRQKQLGQL